MKLIPLIFALLIVLCQIAPAIAVNSKEVTVEKTTKLEMKDASKEKVTIKEFTSTASGDSKVKSKDIELKTEKLDKCLKISSTSKTKSKSVDSHDILVPVKDIQNFNGHSVRIIHFTDAGIQDNEYIQEVTVQDGYVLIPDVEFSSIIVDGFTGTYTKTVVGANITDFSTSFIGNYNSVHVSIPGADGRQMDENNSADYPDGAVLIMPFSYGDARNIVDNSTGTVSNVVIENNEADFNGINSKITNSNSYNVSGNIPFSVHLVLNASYDSGSCIMAQGRTFGCNGDYGWGIGFTNSGILYFDTYNTTTRHALTESISEYENDTLDVVITWDGYGFKQIYLNGVLENSVQSNVDSIGKYYDITIGNEYFNTAPLKAVIDIVEQYDKVITSAEVRQLYTFINGTAARTLPNGTWVPVINGEADLPIDPSGDVTAIEVMTSTGTAISDVSITGSWTDDVTIIEESEDEDHVYVYANITTSQNSTSGSWEYDVNSANFTYSLSLDSTNPNATASYHNGTISVETGQTFAGVEYLYNFTLSKLTAFDYTVNWISKSSTKAVVEYNSTNAAVEQDFYLWNMSASSTFDFKYSNGTILVNATSDSNGYLKFDDVGGVTDSYKLINDTYTIEKQSSTVSFVAVVFAGLSFVGLYFANRFRRR
jgi:hypothetical protein